MKAHVDPARKVEDGEVVVIGISLEPDLGPLTLSISLFPTSL